MKIDESVKMFNTACNIVATMQQRGLTTEDIEVLAKYMGVVAKCEFPAPEPVPQPSPIIVPDSVIRPNGEEVKVA